MATLQKLIAIYARVSTENQKEEKTIEAQLLAIEEYAEKHGYVIIERYIDEGWSGDTIIRPELDRMREDAKGAKWEAVLMYDPDRLARRYYYQEYVKYEVTENGKDILYVTVTAPKNSEDKILGGVRGLFAEYERIKISERMRLGKLRKIKNGHILVSRALYGYDYIPKTTNSQGYYIVNEERAKVVRLVFDLVGNQGLTTQKVILKLQELGIRPQNSERGVWNHSTLSSMLKNPAYIGKAKWGSTYAVEPTKPLKDVKYKKIKKTSRRIKPKEEWMYTPVPVIIDEALFNKTQEQLKLNFERNKRNKVNEYLLSGLIWCTCSKRRTGEGVQGNKHLYYRCTDRVTRFPLPRVCFESTTNARKADEIVWDRVSDTMTRPDVLLSYLYKLVDHKNAQRKVSGFDIESLQKDIKKLKEEEDRYNKAFGAGVFTLEQLKQYVDPIRKKIDQLQKEIATHQQKLRESADRVLLPTENNICKFTDIIKNHIFQLSFEGKRAIMLASIQKIVGNRDTLTVTGSIPFNIISNYYYEYKTSDRNRRAPKCRQKHTL